LLVDGKIGIQPLGIVASDIDTDVQALRDIRVRGGLHQESCDSAHRFGKDVFRCRCAVLRRIGFVDPEAQIAFRQLDDLGEES
jgi:hypothetical protein